MARHKDVSWDLPSPKLETWQQVEAAVLMDIRDELKKLNALLHCANFVQIPATLRGIQRKLTPRVKS